jgi:hypothetical protein
VRAAYAAILPVLPVNQGGNHVQIDIISSAGEAQEKQTHPRITETRASEKLLEKPNPRTQRGEEEKMKTAQDHDHLSYSQINSYTTCPLKYHFNYIDGLEPEFTS